MVDYIGIQELRQVNEDTLLIKWTTGEYRSYSMNSLQSKCPCERCQMDKNPKILGIPQRVYSMGSYALRFEFSAGCSSGIYSYQFLIGLT